MSVRPKGEYAFQGVIGMKVTIGVLGCRFASGARIKWRYTPSWEYFDLRAKRLVSARRSALVLNAELLVMRKKPRSRSYSWKWLPADCLVAAGVFTSLANEILEDAIDCAARRMDLRRRRVLAVE